MSEPQDPVLNDLQARVSRLEAEVSRLAQALGRQASATTGEMPMQAPPRPAPPPPRPPAAPRAPLKPAKPSKSAKPFNATVLVASLGAGIFLLGAIFFLLLAIQRGWIGPELRILLGLTVGGAFAAIGARQLLGGSRGLGVSLLLAGLGTLLFTFWAGAGLYHLYPMQLGFLGAAAIALLAGGLAARAKSQGALVVGLICGFLAPPIFSSGGHHEISLSVYLLLLVGAAAAVPYLAGIGARFGFTRWLLVAWTWLYLGICASEGLREDVGLLGLLMLVHLALAGVWIWLPFQSEPRPSSPTLLWFSLSVTAMGLSAVYWRRLDWPQAWLALPTLGFAALNLGLVKPLRERLGSRQADLGLLVLAGGFLALAVPIALEWRWVGPLWGAFALGLAWATGKAESMDDWDEEETRNLLRLAVGMGVLAGGRWLFNSAFALDHLRFFSSYQTEFLRAPFFNGPFALAVLTIAAWLLMAQREGLLGKLAFLIAEGVANLALALEVAYLVRWLGYGPRAASIGMTLVWVLSGLGQWLASLRDPQAEASQALGWTGLALLALASGKLILVDMAHSDMILRTLAFLAVGALLMGAALLSQKARAASDEERS